MQIDKKWTILAAPIVLVTLYCVGWFWPLVTLIVALSGVTCLALTGYSGYELYTANERDQEHDTQRWTRFTLTSIGTLLCFAVLFLMPSHHVDELEPEPTASSTTESPEPTASSTTESVETMAISPKPNPQSSSQERPSGATTYTPGNQSAYRPSTQQSSSSSESEWGGVNSKIRDAMRGSHSEQQIELEQRKSRTIAEQSGMSAKEYEKLLDHALNNPLIQK